MPYEFFHDSPPLPPERRCRRGHPGRWARRSMRALMGLARTLGNILGRRPPWRSDTGSNSCWYPRAGTLTEVGCMVSAKGNRANSNAHGFAKPGRKNKRFARLPGLAQPPIAGSRLAVVRAFLLGPRGQRRLRARNREADDYAAERSRHRDLRERASIQKRCPATPCLRPGSRAGGRYPYRNSALRLLSLRICQPVCQVDSAPYLRGPDPW
jgi:hypothetical protein